MKQEMPTTSVPGRILIFSRVQRAVGAQGRVDPGRVPVDVGQIPQRADTPQALEHRLAITSPVSHVDLLRYALSRTISVRSAHAVVV